MVWLLRNLVKCLYFLERFGKVWWKLSQPIIVVHNLMVCFFQFKTMISKYIHQALILTFLICNVIFYCCKIYARILHIMPLVYCLFIYILFTACTLFGLQGPNFMALLTISKKTCTNGSSKTRTNGLFHRFAGNY